MLASILAGALAEIAAAATVGNALNGIVGNRADALFVRAVRAVSAGFRSLSGGEEAASASVIVEAIETALRRSVAYHLETLDSQAANLRERLLVDDLKRVCAADPDTSKISDLVSLADAVRPLLASLSNREPPAASTPVVTAFGDWCDSQVGPIPDRLKKFLVNRTPGGRSSWIERFREELAAMVLNHEAFQRLLMISNLSTTAHGLTSIERIAQALRTELHDAAKVLEGVETKVDHMLVNQGEQVAHLRRLNALLQHIGHTPSHEMSARVLANTMFGVNGQAARTALIIISTLGARSDIQYLERRTRLEIFRVIHARLSQVFEDQAYVGRFDGGEFDVIIPGVASLSTIEEYCKQIVEAFFLPIQWEGAALSVQPKIGAAMSPEHGFSPDALLRNAGLALLEAIDRGSPPYIIYAPEIRADIQERRILERDLRFAVETGGLSLRFQSIHALDGGQVVGFETLLRWNHPERGMLSPGLFVPLAEDMGLIPSIGDWMIKAACAQAALWPNDLIVSVNISPLQFVDADFATKIAESLSASGIAPRRLELEITESVLWNGPPQLSGIRL